MRGKGGALVGFLAGFVAFPALLFLAAMCIDERRWDRP